MQTAWQYKHYCIANRFLSQIEIVAKLNSNLDISASAKSYIQNHANTWHVKVILQSFVKGLIFILVQNLYQITSWILCTILVATFDERHQCLRVGTKMCYEVSANSLSTYFTGNMKTHIGFSLTTVQSLYCCRQCGSLHNRNFLKSSLTVNSVKSKLRL